MDRSGQSTVEFALTLVIMMALILFYTQLSLTFAFGNYVHYATFMSARAYLASGPTEGDQRERARKVIVRMLKKSEGQPSSDKYPSIAKGVGGKELPGLDVGKDEHWVDGNREFSWLEGVRYSFRSRLFMIPLGKLQGSDGSADRNSGGLNSITLTSESWLGREPAFDECNAEMQKMGAYFDNGC